MVRVIGVGIVLLMISIPASACSMEISYPGHMESWTDVTLFTPAAAPALIISDDESHFKGVPNFMDGGDGCGPRYAPWVDYDQGEIYWMEQEELRRWTPTDLEVMTVALNRSTPVAVEGNQFYYLRSGGYWVMDLDNGTATALEDPWGLGWNGDGYPPEYRGSWVYIYLDTGVSAYDFSNGQYHNSTVTGGIVFDLRENEAITSSGITNLSSGELSYPYAGFYYVTATASHIFYVNWSIEGIWSFHSVNRNTLLETSLGSIELGEHGIHHNWAAEGDSILISHSHQTWVEVEELETEESRRWRDVFTDPTYLPWFLSSGAIVLLFALLIPIVKLNPRPADRKDPEGTGDDP